MTIAHAGATPGDADASPSALATSHERAGQADSVNEMSTAVARKRSSGNSPATTQRLPGNAEETT
ncbi:hypothetical protein PI125_g16725 [Phytophthora idaei]|nr:hypothetical protein PI125_g16725 [Phytophthora idaei]